MTVGRPSGTHVPFTTDDLDGVDGIAPDELAAEARLARELESVAGRVPVTLPAGFSDRVMAAVALEPVPAPARAATHALRIGAFRALLLSIRDAWRVTFSGGFPMAVRAQALALVLAVTAGLGGASFAAASAVGLFDGTPEPTPSVVPVTPAPNATPEPGETAEPTADPTDTAEPSESPDPSATEATESESPEASEEPSEAPTPKATPHDDGGSGSGSSNPTPKPTKKPVATPRPTPTPTDDGEDQGNDPSSSPDPTETPTPTPTETPASGTDSGVAGG